MKISLRKIKIMTQPKTDWKFASFIEVDKEYKIDSINIWNHYWNCCDRKVEVRGPFEGQVYYFKEYEIRTPQKSVIFVAGEFSNGQLGIYLKDDLSDKKL